jgi:hypothetical protein
VDEDGAGVVTVPEAEETLKGESVGAQP